VRRRSQVPKRLRLWRAGWRGAVMGQDISGTMPCWRDLSLGQRRRLTVLIGRLALRRLSLVMPI